MLSCVQNMKPQLKFNVALPNYVTILRDVNKQTNNKMTQF